MHKHPTPAEIKMQVTVAMIERFGNMTSQQVSDMLEALDTGVKKACDDHDKFLEKMNA